MGVASEIGRRLVQEAEVRLGMSVVDRGELGALRERSAQFEAFALEANELALGSFNYRGGRPQEMLPEKRNRLAQRSRIALVQDPLAGAEAALLANFAFGRGITVPQANDPAVQKVIDEAWSDPLNEEKLTSFEAQRHRSNELLTQANLFPTAYVRNGYVRIGFLDADTVTHVVCDPEDEERPLFYVTREIKQEWDFQSDQFKTGLSGGTQDGLGVPKVTYFPHWRHVEDARQEAADAGTTFEEPPAEKLGKGVTTHIRINRIGRTQFGTPPWARSLRFFRALDDVTEAHTVMAQAASTLVAKRVIKGTPEAVTRNANTLLSQTGEIGAARFGDEPTMRRDQAFPPQAPPPPGSFWLESQADTLESLNLNSGAGQTAMTAQIIRAPISANSGFGQHYLGDASSANLATATSLELPTLMVVQAWQQTTKDMLDWFTSLVIQEAVRAGRLGGYGNTLSEQDADAHGVPSHVARKPLSELCLRETADKAEMERRTGLDLGYVLSLPYPGRRNLPDVVSMATGVAAAYDPQGVNVPLRRHLLMFLATHGMQLEDPAAFVDEVMPEDIIAQMMPGLDAATGEPYVDPRSADYVPPAEPGVAGGQAPASGGRSPGGKGTPPSGARDAQRGRQPPKREMAATKGGASREQIEEFAAATGGLFDELVIDPLLTTANGSA